MTNGSGHWNEKWLFTTFLLFLSLEYIPLGIKIKKEIILTVQIVRVTISSFLRSIVGGFFFLFFSLESNMLH